MSSRGLLLSVALLGLISGAVSQIAEFPFDLEPDEPCNAPKPSTVIPGPNCDYAMTILFKLTSGSSGTVCTWLKCEESVAVIITLEYYLETLIIFSVTDISEYFECITFTVPIFDKEETAYITFSAIGDNIDVSQRRPVAIDVARTACIAQKEKPLNNPGDIVNVRFVCFNENLMPIEKNFTKMTFVDPNGFRVDQILNPSMEHGVVSGSFATSTLSRTGYYSIQLEDDKGDIEYSYTEIQRVELPRFDFNVQCPDTISVLAKTAEIRGSAVYVYGKPVPGIVVAQCCRYVLKYGREANCYQNINDICVEFTNELDENGNFTEILDLDVFNLAFLGFQNYVTCEITMKEYGTGVLVPSSCNMWITDRLAILQLDRTYIGRFYNVLNVQFAATLTDEEGTPLADRTITVRINGNDIKCLTTDANGRVETEIETASYNQPNITLSAIYNNRKLCYGRNDYGNYDSYFPSDAVTLYRYVSPSGSQIRFRPLTGELSCDQFYSLQLDYSFTEYGVGEGVTTTSIKYFIISRNNIAAFGEVSVDLSESYKGSTVINFFTDAKFATGAKVLATVFLRKFIISATTTLDVEVCFENQVYLTFTESVVAPGDTVYQTVTAEPYSFCAFRAKDASYNLIRSYDDFNAYNVYNSVYTYLFGYNYGGIDYTDSEPSCIDGDTEYFINGGYFSPTSSRTDREAYQDFKESSILIVTSLDTRRPKVCGMETEPDYPIYQPFSKEFAKLSVAATASSADSFNTVRDDFRLTIGYVTTIVGLEGEATISLTLPDSVTVWESDVFCTSDQKGIGMTTKPAKVTAIQSFFLEISIPPYNTRGDRVVTVITIVNYLSKCTKVKLGVEESEDYEVNFPGDIGEKCVCSQQRASWKAEITFLNTGNINVTIKAETSKISDTCDGPNDDNERPRSDTVIIGVSVEYEGITRRAASSHLVTLSGSTEEIDITIAEPDDLVPDSFTLIVNIMGDPIALSTTNFNDLLSTPSGCCEQLQAVLLSIIFISRYLENLGMLSDEQKTKMQAKLSTGFMDLLACRQYDAGYSLYTTTYDANSWVTVQAIRTNHHLGKYIFVDEDIQTQDIIYLSRLQDLKSGCLIPKGRSLIYQGDYNITLQFTALSGFILQEIVNERSSAGPVLEGIKKCLNVVDFESLNTLTKAYLLNAVASFGQWDTWHDYLEILALEAITDGDTLYWRNENSLLLKIYQYFPESSTGDILITSYILRSLAIYPNPDQDLTNMMGSIAKWLSGQMTDRGGFYSSQATATAIEALTLFGESINTSELNVDVCVYQDGTEVFNVHITKENRFVCQSMEFHPGFGDYKVVCSGTGSPLIQFAAVFNTKISTGEDSSFLISAQTSATECINGIARGIEVEISLSYTGNRAESGPVVIIFEIMSGHDIYFGSSEVITYYRPEGRRGLFYVDKVSSTTITFSVSLYMRSIVLNLQSASIVVIEMHTGESGAVEYSYPCDTDTIQQVN